MAEVALPEFLCRQRWYPAKDAGKPGVKLSALLRLPISGLAGAIAVWRVTPSGNTPMHLFVPLALVPAQAAEAAQRIAELPVRDSDDGQEMWIVEAFSVDAFVAAWIDLLLRNGEEARGPVRLRTGSTALLARAGLEAGGGWAIRRGNAEQSNISIRVGENSILKVIRKLESGVHPEVERPAAKSSRWALGLVPRFLSVS